MMPDLSNLGEDYYVVEWLIRLASLAIIPFRRTAAATRSWLLLIFFLPVPGLLLFLAIGSPRFPAWRAQRFDRLRPFFAELAERVRARGAVPPEDDAIARLAGRLGYLPATGGNAAEYLGGYDEVIDRLVADIDGARRHVRILCYIFADDETGGRVIAALARAVARGLPCHVLIDPVGSRPWRRGTIARLEEAGVTVRLALPFRLLRGRTRRDMRNHRKLFLIDGAIGYAGSQNIVRKDFRPGVTNRELVLRVRGPAVAEMSAVFLADWYLETEQLLEAAPVIPAEAGQAIVQILPSGAEFPLEGFHTLLVWQVNQARERIVIVTPYLVPDEALLGALSTAALRNVEIDLVVSAVVDQPLVNLAQCSYYDELLSSGVRIHRYRTYLLHAKNVCIDDRLAVLGSSNVDIRSFQLNEEISLLLYDAGSIAELRAVQQDYLDNSDPVDRTAWRQRSGLRKLAENGARLVGPLL
ncbi:cardiolipin synthase [Flavisphingomonas formosensis]|uniref:cardiolipin synthase n=1 Tax=Flavisphingomonas formosensis TaxID=861534 RepID=UPI0012FB8E01|nr:cardiolipin synthase [Sphingomonas formosensis]